jgi:glycosyltransferase involved in cell wall biosynthesis
MLSVILITKNEANNIVDCLASVAWADEIIVFDSGSEDETVSICREYTDKVYETDWPGFGIQKQRALNKAKGDWVLSIDADEIVTAELRVEIVKAIQQEKFQGFEIPRLSTYCGKQIRHAGWWPDHVLRLFRRECGYFTEASVHERIIVRGQIGRLNYPFLHNAFIDFDEVLRKVNHYSTLGAEALYERGVQSSLKKAVIKALWTFIRTYFIKLAFMDGHKGFMLSISNAEGCYYKYIKLLQLQSRE